MRLAMIAMIAACGGQVQPSPSPGAGPPPRTIERSFADPYEFLPADTSALIMIDMPAVRRSHIWTKHEHDALELFSPRFVKCGYTTALAEVTSIALAVPPREEDDSVVVARGLDRDMTMKCMAEPDADSTVRMDGAVATWSHTKAGTVNVFTFANAKTLVSVGSKHATRDDLAKVLELGAPLRTNAMFMELAKQLEPGAALSMVVTGSSMLSERTATLIGGPSRYLVMSLRVDTDTIEWVGHLGVPSAEQATAVADRVRSNVEALRAMVERMDVTAEGDALRFDGAVTEAQIDAIVAMVRPLMKQ
jgi:hypothetical protein